MTDYQPRSIAPFDPLRAAREFAADVAELAERFHPTDPSRLIGGRDGAKLADPYQSKAAIRWLETAIVHIAERIEDLPTSDMVVDQVIAEALIFIAARHTTEADRDERLYGGAVDR